VGTRFWASQEAAITRHSHQHALQLSGDDTIRQTVFDLIRDKDWPPEYTGRVLHNKFVANWHGREAELVRELEHNRQRFRSAVRDQDFEVANVIVGEGIGLIRSVNSSAAIVDSMVSSAAALLNGSFS